jgi:hypothetical protein
MRRQEREMMGCDVLNGANFIRCGRRQGDNSFPKKMVPFYFNSPRNPDAESRSQKGEV